MLFYFLTFRNNYKYNIIYYPEIDEMLHYGNDMVSLVMKNTIALGVCLEIVFIN